ncbi:hypothetical protein CMQ_1886 [Grosmannia clavigera kw1407]|uniref:Uncharacterized protein n=1 Tax=Grosmannia clavigera (strain kw1407 / UAMH 11150) TaxID=655863 RepID=F0XMX6_GROCL|nr:uncharacterized protein CMQ_1886 [Grosmannia clavigera kw1407]EFX00805.1 hypothetical protein CMQ_1886 [Grosmannia clavigera kw1407]
MIASLSVRRAAQRPDLWAKLGEMALTLAPLVQTNSGRIHPAFPLTLLHFWLLTDEELDELAHFYHQRTPSLYSHRYPCPVRWPRGLSIEEKRRKLGKFIGLRGCETPPPSSPSTGPASSSDSLCHPVAPTLVDRAPNCRGTCHWDVDRMTRGPSFFCLACAASQGAASKRLPPKAAPKHRRDSLTSNSRCLTPSARISRRSPPPTLLPRLHPTTVDEIIEAARRARLAGDASEEAMRLKTGC